jgi:transposase
VPSMPHDEQSSHVRTDIEEVILAVDTHKDVHHKDVHVAAVITVLGVPLASAEFATTGAGYRRLLAWARGFGCWTAPGWRAPDPTARP